MHYPLVAGILGRLMLVYGLFMIVPLALAIIWREASIGALTISMLSCLVTGGVMAFLAPSSGRIGIREGYATVLGGWLFASLFGALPYWLGGVMPTYIDAVFETVSGLTTTGASVIDRLDDVPRSIIFWRSMTHWLGGMGIIVLFIVILPHIGAGAAHLFKAEVPGPTADRVSPRIRDTAIALWIIYTILTVAEIVLLMLAGMSLFDAINHAFATLATGGFSTKDASIKHYDSLAIELIVVLFMIIAGGNFALYFQGWQKGWHRVYRDTEFKVYLVIIAASTFLIAVNLCLAAGEEAGKALRVALFQVASIITTTGFASADFDAWPPLAKLVLFILMFIGGSAGSTAGGIKVSRIILLVKQGWAELKRSLHPRVVVSICVDQKSVEPTVLNTVCQFFFLYMFTFFAAVLLVAATGLAPFDAMSAVAATLGNVGPGFGVVGPTTTYSSLSPLAKTVLTLCMLLGRLELFTLLVFLRPEFWRAHRNW